MIDLATRCGIGAAVIAMCRYQQDTVPMPDGTRLMLKPRPEPFHLRWLLPTVLGDRKWAWCLASWLSLIATCALFPGDLWALGLWVSLPWFRTMVLAPVLTDAPSMALALSGMHLRGWVAVAVGALSGTVGEKAPVFFGLFGQHWLAAFCGLTVVLMAHRWVKSAPRDEPPALQVGRARAFRWSHGPSFLMPWGAGLFALIDPSWTVADAAVVAVAYGQMLVAFDTVRMYMWAAPVVLPRAVAVIPARWLPVAVIATWFNPLVFQKKGVIC